MFPLDHTSVFLTADTEDVLVLLLELHTPAQLILCHRHLLCLCTQKHDEVAVMSKRIELGYASPEVDL